MYTDIPKQVLVSFLMPEWPAEWTWICMLTQDPLVQCTAQKNDITKISAYEIVVQTPSYKHYLLHGLVPCTSASDQFAVLDQSANL
jgi:hypothetical protein